MRITLALSIVSLFAASACTSSSGGDPDAGNDNGTADGGDSSSDGSNGPIDAGSMPDAPAFQCRNKVTFVGTGHHNAGLDCNGSCHNHGFTLAGTLYSSASGGLPAIGASITVIDATGKTFDIVSQLNGNFYTSTSVTFPVTVYASSCPDVQMMSAHVESSSHGGCNRSGCHTSNGQGHIHLP